jgi:Flp pilus assembly protein TadG
MMVVYSIVLTALLGFCAVAADVGSIVIEKQKLQNAVDAASIAAAQELPDKGKAIDKVNKYIGFNGYSPSHVEVTFSDSDMTITVKGSKKVNFLFAKIIGFQNTTIAPSASASVSGLAEIFDYTLFSGSGTTP